MYGAKVSRCDEVDCIHNVLERKCNACVGHIIVRIDGGKCASFETDEDYRRDRAKRAIIDYLGKVSDETIDGIFVILKARAERGENEHT